MKKNKVAIIGAGNIGTSLARGLVFSGKYKKSEIILTEKRESRIELLRAEGFTVTSDNREALKNAVLLVISVKPQQFAEVVEEIAGDISKKQTVISTVTGTFLKDIEAALGKIPLVRIMPNTALEICESMTCMAFRNVSAASRDEIVSLFDSLGRTLIISEDLMDASTVIGACGIAFALRFMRAMSQGGIEIGFNAEMSQLITAQTMRGAAGLILETDNHPEKEIDKVTTPQGITISGLNEMEHQGLSSAVIKGLTTSYNKLGNLSAKHHK
jgi:pyrroline-5-carboxylate reductase